jgi:hypothetical protein
MLTKTLVIVSLLATFIFAASAFAGPNMQEGKWEITTKVEMQGMPMSMPATKHSMCLTDKDMVPQKPEKNQDCKMIDTKVSGDTVTWKMHCKMDETVVDSNGKITYKKDKFDGVVHMTMTDPDSEKMEMTSTMSGKRIGDCK